jgi:hypothetical protein
MIQDTKAWATRQAKDVAVLGEGFLKVVHPLDVLAVNVSMFFVAGVADYAGVAVAVGGCADFPADLVTCGPSIFAAGVLLTTGTIAEGTGIWFFYNYTIPSFQNWMK